MKTVIKLLTCITAAFFFAHHAIACQAEKYRLIEKYICTSHSFENYLLTEYRKNKAEICFITVENSNRGTVIVLNFYDKSQGIDNVYGTLDVKKRYNIFLYGNNNCDIFQTMNKYAKVKVKKFQWTLDEDGYIDELDDGIMTSVLYNNEGYFEMDWKNHSIHRIEK